ncbi:MAG: hypothetical protein A3B66_00420 [Alphaproteobacteria bacterium RIFCSPHIGHO2_02_FULL_46_13]|nr:MAG: hypothetical protein A3B66_00420 [Alphaproteobacteria bacterium RIFCSPHIGHO2_02_FULL_46_13]
MNSLNLMIIKKMRRKVRNDSMGRSESVTNPKGNPKFVKIITEKTMTSHTENWAAEKNRYIRSKFDILWCVT